MGGPTPIKREQAWNVFYPVVADEDDKDEDFY